MALPLPALFHAGQLLKCARLAGQFAHFLSYSPALIDALPPARRSMALGDFLTEHGYSSEFAAELLYPMLSVVCTCSYKAVAAYPAQIIVDYFGNKYGFSGAQCRAYGGTRDVVDRLTAPVRRVVTAATVTSAEAASLAEKPGGKLCSLSWRDADGVEHTETFDEIVLAMQANASGRVLRTPHAVQLDALRAFEYESKRVVLHTDDQLMPPHARDWSPLNIVTQPEAEAASVTVWMNRIDSDLRSQLRRPLFQTWNPVVEPAKSHVIADFSFERPVVNAASVAAMAELKASQGHGHVWFVGAYSRYSMPLLENGVKSAMEVARALGVDVSDVEFDESAVQARRDSSSLTLSLILLVVAIALTLAHASYF